MQRRLKQVRVGAVQMISCKGRVGDNVAKALNYCDRAAKKSVEILCLPECASTGFEWLDDRGAAVNIYAESVPGSMVEVFAEKARATMRVRLHGFFSTSTTGVAARQAGSMSGSCPTCKKL